MIIHKVILSASLLFAVNVAGDLAGVLRSLRDIENAEYIHDRIR